MEQYCYDGRDIASIGHIPLRAYQSDEIVIGVEEYEVRGDKVRPFSTDGIHCGWMIPCLFFIRRRSISYGMVMDWLDVNHERDSFFIWIDTFDPHRPWDMSSAPGRNHQAISIEFGCQLGKYLKRHVATGSCRAYTAPYDAASGRREEVGEDTVT